MRNLQNSSTSDNPSLKAALHYAERGWQVFPLWSRNGDKCGCGDDNCKSQGKHPLSELAPDGFKNATTDEKEIKRWWRKYPDAGIGVVTGKISGVIVLDIDCKKDRDGTLALGPLLAKLGPLPDSKAAVTASGGTHHYFRYEDGIRCSNDKLGKGLDIKADGGYVCAPPSHGLYRWDDGRKAAKLPEAWREHLLALQSPPGTPGDDPEADPKLIAKALAVIPNGATVGWDQWNKIGMATFRATGGTEEGFKLFDEWSQKWFWYDAQKTRDKWEALTRSPPNQIGAGTLFHLANEASPGWRHGPALNKRLDELAKLDEVSYDHERIKAAKELAFVRGLWTRNERHGRSAGSVKLNWSKKKVWSGFCSRSNHGQKQSRVHNCCRNCATPLTGTSCSPKGGVWRLPCGSCMPMPMMRPDNHRFCSSIVRPSAAARPICSN